MPRCSISQVVVVQADLQREREREGMLCVCERERECLHCTALHCTKDAPGYCLCVYKYTYIGLSFFPSLLLSLYHTTSSSTTI